MLLHMSVKQKALTQVAAGAKARAVASNSAATADNKGSLILQSASKFSNILPLGTLQQRQFVAFIAAIMVSHTAAVLVLVSCVHVHGFLPVAPLLKPSALQSCSTGLVMSSDVVPQPGYVYLCAMLACHIL
jgi:hypothetical protein